MIFALLTKQENGSFDLPVVWSGKKVNKALSSLLEDNPSQDFFKGDHEYFGVFKVTEEALQVGNMWSTPPTYSFDGLTLTLGAEQEADPSYVAPAVDSRTPLDIAKENKLAEMANARYEEEVGGLDFAGMNIATDRDSQSTLVGARMFANADPSFVIDNWKAGGTFVTLDAPTIMAISDAVLAHVQSLFTKEATKASLISVALSLDELDAITWE